MAAATRGSWRETLLVCWIAVPVAFFQLFPIKGFQYLLPIAPAVALLAARFLAQWESASLAPRRRPRFLRDRHLTGTVIAIVAATLAVASWSMVQPSKATTFLAGSGGVPGGREAGRWIDRNIPVGFNVPTIFDRLEAKRVSWKFYVQNYDPRITFRSRDLGDRGSQVVWVPLLSYPRYLDNPRLFGHIVPIEQFYDDARRGTLPAVSYIVPSGSSEHPPGSIKAGETFVRTLINALARSRLWKSSALTWTYDDWGGWFDHVRPPRVDRFGYGFRAPALLVSPWARRGSVNHATLDFTSLLKFIEDNWGLAPLARRDRRAQSIMSAFDFTRPPRAAAFLDRVRDRPQVREPRRWPVYVSYSVALAAALALIAAAGRSDRRRPPLAGRSTRLHIEPLVPRGSVDGEPPS